MGCGCDALLSVANPALQFEVKRVHVRPARREILRSWQLRLCRGALSGSLKRLERYDLIPDFKKLVERLRPGLPMRVLDAWNTGACNRVCAFQVHGAI